MKSHLPHRAGRPQAAAPAHLVPVPAPIHHAPNAALLIDFDNVTLGVRSDLAKELRTLLNSDIIKGKVAVQRAYADWRRYPQYIVSLSESSIDLIFAPAFGTNKKNATDIRLAVDATELVFTRPEIGTFILLSGDSDFSSLVLKLKEYGKYVIGVGIRESASDILIQNCDEYYSYSDLAGLSKEADVPGPPRDPWELVVAAVAQMTANRDVMRADRLKQVMQQLDSSFDESNAGYNRFSKFVTEAGTRGLIRVIKQENGQLDVAPLTGAPVKPAATVAAATPRRGERSAAAAPSQPRDAAGEESAPSRRRRGGRGRGRPNSGDEAAAPGGSATEPPTAAPRAISAASAASARAIVGLTLAEAFHLLSRALGELPAPVPHETLRARMAALYGKEDPLLAPARFDKFLRQANDAEVADVRMVADNQYEISQHKADLALQMRAPVAAAAPAVDGSPAVPVAATVRFRGAARAGTKPPAMHMVGVIDFNGGRSAAPVPTVASELPADVSPDAPAAAPAVHADTATSKSPRSPRGGEKRKAVAAPVPAPTASANRKRAPKAAVPRPAASTTSAAVKPATPAKPPAGIKPSKPRTSKPRAG